MLLSSLSLYRTKRLWNLRTWRICRPDRLWSYHLIMVWLLIASASTPAYAGLKVGQTAPEFTLPDLKGKKHSLSELRKQGHVLLVFWAIECVYCYAHIKDYKAIYNNYHGKGLKKGVTIAAINIGGEYPEDVAEYVKDNALPYLTLVSRLDNLDVSDAYNAIVTPTMVLISPAGKVVYYGYDIPNISSLITK